MPNRLYRRAGRHREQRDGERPPALAEKLPYLDLWNKKRINNARYYNGHLQDLHLRLPLMERNGRPHIFHHYVIRTKTADEREGLGAHLQKKGVGSGIYYPLPL